MSQVKGNQVMERISFLEESNSQCHELIEEIERDRQELEEENRHLQRQVESLRNELYRLKFPEYLIAM